MSESRLFSIEFASPCVFNHFGQKQKYQTKFIFNCFYPSLSFSKIPHSNCLLVSSGTIDCITNIDFQIIFIKTNLHCNTMCPIHKWLHQLLHPSANIFLLCEFRPAINIIKLQLLVTKPALSFSFDTRTN